MAAVHCGILVTADDLRVVALRGRKGRLSVLAAGAHDFSSDEKADPGPAIKQVLRKLGVSADAVWCALPKEQATLQPATLPSHDPAELREMARFEAERHIPFNAERHGVGFHPVRDLGDAGTQVLLAAADGPVIERVLGACEHAGVRSLGLNVSSICLMNAFLHAYPDIARENTVLIAGMSLGSLDLVFASEGRMLFSRSVPFGLRGLVQDLRDASDAAPMDAARIATAARMLDMLDLDAPAAAGPRAGSARNWANRLVKEIRTSYDFARREMNCPPIEGLILAGEGSVLRNLDRFLANHLHVEALPLAPLAALPWKCEKNLPFGGLELTVPFGAAIQGELANAYKVDLSPPGYYERIERKRLMRRLMTTGAFALFAGGIAFAAARNRAEITSRLVSAYEEALLGIRSEVRDLREKEIQLDVLESFLADPASAPAVLARIAEYPKTPERVTMTSISYERDDQVVIEGHAVAVPDINEFIEYLKRGDYPKEGDPSLFEKVELIAQEVYASLSNRPSVYRFRLQCAMRKFERKIEREPVSDAEIALARLEPPERELETEFVPSVARPEAARPSTSAPAGAAPPGAPAGGLPGGLPAGGLPSGGLPAGVPMGGLPGGLPAPPPASPGDTETRP